MSDVAFADALAREAAGFPLLRAHTPEETLTAITPVLPGFGITRAASITHLDTLGVPTWVSVRPGGQILQVSNGKGVTDTASQVSALMEACELHLAENPRPERLFVGSRCSGSSRRANDSASGGPRPLRPNRIRSCSASRRQSSSPRCSPPAASGGRA